MSDYYNAFEMSPVPAPGPDAGWSVWIRGGRPCGWQNRTARVLRAFGIRTGKQCLSTAASGYAPSVVAALPARLHGAAGSPQRGEI